MKKIYISLGVIAFGVSLAGVINGAMKLGLTVNVDKYGEIYQETCPIGDPGTFLMSDPSSPCGMSWQKITMPTSPFIITKVTSSPSIVTLISGYKMASTTVTNTVK